MHTNVDWEHVYLLGYYGKDGRSYLTSWDGDGDSISVVVFGTGVPPLWASTKIGGATLQEIPEGENGQEYAKKVGGIYAFGWYFEDGFKRGES